MKRGNGVGESEDREEGEGLRPAVGIQEAGVVLTAATVTGPTARHLTLKLPYRTCSVGLTWTHGSCLTRAGGRPRSDKTQPGTLKQVEEEVEGDRHHQLHPNTHRLSVPLLSILVVPEP